MWRLLKFLITGDGHAHKWKFTRADHYSTIDGRPCNMVGYVKVCEICGKHRQGKIWHCLATSADELNP